MVNRKRQYNDCLFLLTILLSFSVYHVIFFFCWPLYCLLLLTIVLSFPVDHSIFLRRQ
jgi:hypothetical protein